MESAEKRDALKKSLNYLEEAEELDRLNPAVRRAKARLLVSAAMRHLRQHKTHLVPAEIEQLLAVPEVRQGDVSTLAAVLSWCCAVTDRDNGARQEREKELLGTIGPVATDLLILAVARAAGLSAVFSLPFDAGRTPPSELLAGAVRACLIGEWVGLSIPLLLGWTGRLIEAIHQPGSATDAAQLLVLGEAALGDSARELAYAVSGAGLALLTAHARFLYLRARALPIWMDIRREGCLRAALELARRERDGELSGKILDHLGGRFSPDIRTDSLPSELSGEIIEEELRLKKFPTTPRDNEPRYATQLVSRTDGDCDCPKCRARRGEPVDWDEEDDEDIWDEEDFDGPPLKAIPEAIAAILDILPAAERERILKAIESGADPLEIIDRIDQAVKRIAPGPRSPSRAGRSSNDKKRDNAGSGQEPVQGRLF